MKLEICTHTIESALNAQKGGADRIELCVDLSVGGLTPSYGLIKIAKKLLEIPVFVLIRPRAGDFVYSKMELEVMKEDIAFCSAQQVEGVVIGALRATGEVNEAMTAELMKAAGYMDITFHRAFDETPNQFEALETLKDLGVQRILTSGGKGNAIDNIEQLEALIDEASEDVIIMPGGGVRPDNAQEIIELGANEIHSSCIIPGQSLTDLTAVTQLKTLVN